MGVQEFIKIRTIIRQDDFEGEFKMRPKKDGFTTIELLVVIAIIAILMGILVPALTYVRKTANEAKQKAQFAAIAMALDAFKGDYGDYPPSHCFDSACSLSKPETYYYCGAQTLAEALVGRDLLGFNPHSAWRSDGMDSGGVNPVYSTTDANLADRVGPYLELGSASAFKLLGSSASDQGLFYGTPTYLTDTYVLCDSFGAKSVTVNGKTVKAGRPILYYKANVASKDFTVPLGSDLTAAANRIYNYMDNIDLIGLQVAFETLKNPSYSLDPLYYKSYGGGLPGTYFYSPDYKLLDQKVYAVYGTSRPWPCRPDSYILISAGADGVYGTNDDITNF
jgi:prepilin-type N-terminal cleavage/methylation domain-containing protein